MKPNLILLMIASALSITTFAQTEYPTDESLIIKFAKVASGGYVSKLDIAKANSLEANEKDAVIVSFDYVCRKEGYEANIHNMGPQLSEQILNHMKNAKIGTKVSFENIRVDNASGELMARPLLLTIKS